MGSSKATSTLKSEVVTLSSLTKAFVVLVTVLSVVLVALIVPFVAKIENFANTTDKLKTERTQAREAARIAEGELSAVQTRLSELATAHGSQKAKLTAQIIELQSALDKARDQVNQERAGLADLKTAFSRLTSANEQANRLLAVLNDELKTGRKQMVDLRTKVIELTDKNNELSSLVLSYDRNLRRLKEENTAMAEQLEALVQTGGQVPAASAELPAAPLVAHPISGRVTRVDAATDTTFVEVNIGRKDGMAEGMDLIVYRGEDEYLGTLMIDKVDSTASAGHMVRMGISTLVVEPGDSTIYPGSE